MKIQADLSVCTTVFSNAQPLRTLLRSLYETADPVSIEVLVVDASGQVAALLQKEFPHVIIYDDPHETNTVRARNRALSLASGRYLSVWDNDACIAPNCLQTILDFLDQTPDVGLAGPLISDAHGKTEPSPHKFPSLTTISSPLSPLNRLHRHNTGECRPPHSSTQLQESEIDWLQSGCHIIRRELFEEIGFYDSAFCWPYAEMDYYFRARKAGWHNFLYPNARIIHANPSRYHREFRTPLPLSRVSIDALRHLRKKWFPGKDSFQSPGF